MEFVVKNYLHLADVTQWSCYQRFARVNGTTTIVATPIPPSHSRMIVEIRGVIYVDALASWQGLSLNIASKEDLTQFLPNLGNHLRTKLGDEHIIENYELFVVRGDKRDYYFVAQDCVIDKTLP